MVLFGSDSDRSTRRCGTVSLHRALSAILDGEFDFDDLVVTPIYRRSPAQALSACRADHFLPVPINLETASVKPPALFRLPLVIGSRWRYQVDPIVASALNKLLGFCVIGVGQMLFRQHIF